MGSVLQLYVSYKRLGALSSQKHNIVKNLLFHVFVKVFHSLIHVLSQSSLKFSINRNLLIMYNKKWNNILVQVQ